MVVPMAMTTLEQHHTHTHTHTHTHPLPNTECVVSLVVLALSDQIEAVWFVTQHLLRLVSTDVTVKPTAQDKHSTQMDGH